MVTSVSSTTITKKQKKIQLRKTCGGCYYGIKDKCYWFKDIDGTPPKVIPEEVYNKGCTKYKNTNMVMSVSEQQQLILNKFDGEILSDKYKIYKRQYKTYKKKYVKSAHNYSYRKDAQ